MAWTLIRLYSYQCWCERHLIPANQLRLVSQQESLCFRLVELQREWVSELFGNAWIKSTQLKCTQSFSSGVSLERRHPVCFRSVDSSLNPRPQSASLNRSFGGVRVVTYTGNITWQDVLTTSRFYVTVSPLNTICKAMSAWRQFGYSSLE